jgi:hypothetical protein
MKFQRSRYPPSNTKSRLPEAITPQTSDLEAPTVAKQLIHHSLYTMLKHLFSPKQSPQPDPYQSIRVAIAQEHLRQARQTFDLFRIAIGLSLSVSVVGCIVVVTGQATEGTVTTATGLASTTLCAQIAKEARDKLDRLSEDLQSSTQSEG